MRAVEAWRTGRHGGFTLIEIIIVLVIMAAMAGLVAVRIASGSPAAEVRAAARDIASGLRYARSQAIVSGREQVLIIDTAEGRYWLLGDGAKRETIPESVSVELVTAAAETRGQNRGGYRFYPDGSATGGRITLSVAASRFQVDVDWLTGRVRIAG